MLQPRGILSSDWRPFATRVIFRRAHLDNAINVENEWRSAGLRHGASGLGLCNGAVPEAGVPMAVSGCATFHINMQKLAAELFGTFFLVFAGTGAIVINDLSNGAITHVGIALTFGLVVLALIYALGEVSGAHFNPAVT